MEDFRFRASTLHRKGKYMKTLTKLLRTTDGLQAELDDHVTKAVDAAVKATAKAHKSVIADSIVLAKADGTFDAKARRAMVGILTDAKAQF